MNKIRDRWRFVAASWFALSAEDQKEALAVAAAESGWPAFLLEKDIWVVWALQILGTDQQLLQSLTFKGGSSLSKAHGLIDRFSEDVDLTVNIQHLWPDVDLAPAVNPSQAEGAVRPLTASSSNGSERSPCHCFKGLSRPQASR